MWEKVLWKLKSKSKQHNKIYVVYVHQLRICDEKLISIVVTARKDIKSPRW